MEDKDEKPPLDLSEEQLQEFGTKFLRKYLVHGYGTMPKREIDILVFHLISRSPDLLGKSNYQIANELRLPEARVKAMRLEASLKHDQAIHSAVISKIILRLIDEVQKPDFGADEIAISLEDPVEKREFEYAVKKIGKHVEYGINREILKIKPLQLIELIFSTVENGEREFARLVRANVKSRNKQQKIIKKALPLSERVKALGKQVQDNASLVSLAIQAAPLV